MQMFITNGLGIPVDAIREIQKVKELKATTNNSKDVKGSVKRRRSIKGVVK